MSFQILADVFAYLNSDFPPDNKPNSFERLILHTIAHFSHQDGTGAYPSLPTLQRLTDLSRPTIKRALKELERRCVLTKEIKRGNRGYSVYTITLPHVDITKKSNSYTDTTKNHKGSSRTLKGVRQNPNPFLEPEERKNSSRAREVEDREKTVAELDQLLGSTWNPRKLQLFGATPGSGFYNVCANGNGPHEKDSS